jgi:hypothetical protein
MHVERYIGRISGPLLDRIDLHIEVPAVPFQELAGDGTSSASMREQVSQAREAQRWRFGMESHRQNGRMNSRQLRVSCLKPQARRRPRQMPFRRGNEADIGGEPTTFLPAPAQVTPRPPLALPCLVQWPNSEGRTTWPTDQRTSSLTK